MTTNSESEFLWRKRKERRSPHENVSPSEEVAEEVIIEAETEFLWASSEGHRIPGREKTAEGESSVKPEAELLWRLFEEHRVSARHYDEQREKVTHCVLLLVAAALGLTKLGDPSSRYGYILAAFVIILGLAGCILTAINSSGCGNNFSCAKGYRSSLEELYPKLKLEKPQPEFINQTPWLVIHIMIIILGCVLCLPGVMGQGQF